MSLAQESKLQIPNNLGPSSSSSQTLAWVGREGTPKDPKKVRSQTNLELLARSS
eukprot:CAMPEP_0195016988 /NCGR_PEP_ID=MMETSP0326_2-20130528/26017_1 /TAXON_ID=2866 ORGANISM="Crypthecodinium cohnii, Strain Seligo" /NCGR_SAMPLE_ID=MMETSP0326_2 /ASSEMBLY_ACC=CAM_ASM_000348 /LENGTH=53 /DNA_ID=CAMNT_0040033133 /DNA_START=130 /DNA_END=291 /DNA_ORIENTATION=+